MKITVVRPSLDIDPLFLKPKSMGVQLFTQVPGQCASIVPSSSSFPISKIQLVPSRSYSHTHLLC